MKLKKFLAGFLAGALVLTGIPVSGLEALSAEAAAQTDLEAGRNFRYRPINESMITVSSNIAAEALKPDRPLSNLNSKSGYMVTEQMADGVSGKNIYFTLESPKQLGAVKYYSAGSLGSIKKCQIWVSNVDEEAAEIHESGWLKVYDNTSGDAWNATAANDVQEAVFDFVQTARHVRITVQETYGNDTADTENKQISGARVQLMEAGRLDQVEYSDDIAIASTVPNKDGKVTVKVHTGGNGLNSINGTGNNPESENGSYTDGSSDYWYPGSHVSSTNSGAANYNKVNYIIYDLHDTATEISGINVRWNSKSWAGKYYIETADTCHVGNNEPGGENVSAAAELSALETGDEWEKVVDFDRGFYDDGNDADGRKQPLDEFTLDNENENLKLKSNTLKRYVRLVIRDNNPGAAGLPGGAVRELEIIGSKWRTAAAENVAIGIDGSYADGRKGSTTVVGYSGNDMFNDENTEINHKVENALDGTIGRQEGNVANHDFWMPSVLNADSNRGLNMAENGDTAHLVLDLGVGTVTEVQSMKINWFGANFAKNVKVYTSENYTMPTGATNPGDLDMLRGDNIFGNGWELVVTATDSDSETTNKELTFPDTYTTKQLKRYVRFEFSELNANADIDGIGPNVAVSQIDIQGIRRVEETTDMYLTVEEPSLGALASSVQAAPAIGDDGAYDVASTEWYQTTGTGNSITHTKLAEDAKFEVGKIYTMVVKLRSKNKFASLYNVVVNGETDSPAVGYGSNPLQNYNGAPDAADTYSYLTVSKTFSGIENPTASYEALKAELLTGTNAAAMKTEAHLTEEQAFAKYTKRSWLTFKAAYDDAVSLVGEEYQEAAGAAEGDEEDDGLEDPNTLYPKKRYDAALQALQEEFATDGMKGLKAASKAAEADLSDENNVPKAIITRTASEQKVEMANKTRIAGSGDRADVNFDEKIQGLPDFEILWDGSFRGAVKAPESEGVNNIFEMGQAQNAEGQNSFLIRCTLGLPTLDNMKANREFMTSSATKITQSIIGKFNDQYGIQIQRSYNYANDSYGNTVNLCVYGYTWAGWGNEVKFDITEYMGQSVDLVVVYNQEGKFEAYVIGDSSSKGGVATRAAGKLRNSKTGEYPMFAIGYNPQVQANGDTDGNAKGATQAYTGTMKDFVMYTYKAADGEAEGNSTFLKDDYQTPAEGDRTNPTTLSNYFTTLLEGKEPNIDLHGEYALYDVKNYTWLKKDSDTEVEYPSPYEDYRLKVDVTTNEMPTDGDGVDAYFGEAAESENFLYLPGEGNTPVKVSEDDIVSRSRDKSETVLSFVYNTTGAKAPKTELEEYLAAHPKQDEKNDAGEPKYTRQSWQAYRAAYDTAVALTQSTNLNRKQEVYAAAKTTLETAETGLTARTDQTCECAIGAIVYNGSNVLEISKAEGAEAETGSLDLKEGIKVLHDRYNCLMHGADTEVELSYNLTDNTAQAEVENGVLTATAAGQVKVTIGAQFGSQSAQAKEVMFTVVSAAGKEQLKNETQQAKKEANDLLATNNADGIYTSESWAAFESALEIANSNYTNLDSLNVTELEAAKAAFEAAKANLVKQSLADAMEDARTALAGAVENNNEGTYTTESWNEYAQIKADLAAELEKDAPDESRLIALTTALGNTLKLAPTQAEKDLAAAKENAQTALNSAVKDSDKDQYTNWAGYADLKAKLEAAIADPNAKAEDINSLIQQLQGYKLQKKDSVTPGPGPGPGPGPNPIVPTETFKNVKNVRYEVDKKNKNVAVAVKGLKDAKSVTIQKTVTINGKSYKVEKIGAGAFKGFKKLTSVTVGVNVKTIEKQAFMNCKKLKKVTLSNGKALKTIGTKAFKGTKKGLTVKAKKLTKAKARKALLKKVKKAGAKSAKVTK